MDYYASGKLLLFGEYLVLRGAGLLAIPLKYGQQMKVIPISSSEIKWTSRVLDKEWFTSRFTIEGSLIETNDEQIAATIIKLFQIIRSENPSLFHAGYHFTLQADFPIEWGIGSSSTLISLLAQWSNTDPFFLLENTFGGSGYDVACATSPGPVMFEAMDKKAVAISLSLAITSKMLFVYSGKKQISRNEVARFEKMNILPEAIGEMNNLVSSVISCEQVEELERLMDQSEKLLSRILGIEPIKKSTFSDYPYGVKSLGAWGGDFFMATYRNEQEARNYFNDKGYNIQFTYDQIIKK
ncbi:MAG: GYDIA family GHMP kinase [Ginsengibacter sp.]